LARQRGGHCADSQEETCASGKPNPFGRVVGIHRTSCGNRWEADASRVTSPLIRPTADHTAEPVADPCGSAHSRPGRLGSTPVSGFPHGAGQRRQGKITGYPAQVPMEIITFPNSPFRLHQLFSPAGDQPQAIDKLTEGLNDGLAYQTLLGVTGSGKTYTMANVIARTGRPTLVIAPNKTLAAQLYSEFREFFPENAVE